HARSTLFPYTTLFRSVGREWPEVFDASKRAEEAARADPRTGCFYARRALELAMSWLYKHDPALKLPYEEQLAALIHDPTFKQTVDRKSTRLNSSHSQI